MKNFLDSKDYEAWKHRCALQRKIAYEHPATALPMMTCVDYDTDCGPEWHLRLVLVLFTPRPHWFASICHITKIGDEIVYDKITGLPIFEAPQDALVMVKDWTHEENDVANSLLGDLVGPLIATKDQRVNIHDVAMCRQWTLDAQEVAKNVASRN